MTKEKTYDVLVIGELNVDIILNQISSFPEMGKEKTAGGMSVVLGSSSAILACNLSTLGVKTGFIGKVGNDTYGELILNALSLKGVDTSLITCNAVSGTSATVVMSFENDRANVTYPGAMNELMLSDIKDENLMNTRHVHLSSCFLQQGIKDDLINLFKKAKRIGLTTSLDPQWDPEEKWDIQLSELLPYIDFFMPNISELKALSGTEDLDAALNSLKNFNTIVVKMGTLGVCLYSKGQKKMFPAYINTEVVDTIGAGDSFNSGFLYQYLQGASLDNCVQFGSYTAAVSTTDVGGTGAFKSFEHVMQIMKTKFGYKEYETIR